MDNLLIGNGLNIEFAKQDISNKGIILRAIDNIKERKINTDILIDEPDLLLSFFGRLYRQIDSILNGDYIDCVITTDDKISYKKFLEDYGDKRVIRITDIGFEDYFFIYHLVRRKYNIDNENGYIIMKTLERYFIDSIFNEGKINKIYKDYPETLKDFFMNFDNIFTTNYDENISLFTGRTVYYLHGAFHIKADVYDSNSMRNKLYDAPLKDIEVDENYYHLYSNCITTYSGNNKLFVIRQSKCANEVISKFAEGYKNRPEIKADIDNLKESNNEIERKMYESTVLKLRDKSLSFSDNYPIEEFKNIVGDITIVGLAPNNDIHIFEMINKNPSINKVYYYYYSPTQNNLVKDMLNNKKVEFKNVNDLWILYS